MAVFIECKVIPSSGRQELVRDKSGIIKCFLKSPPEKGKANYELIDLISSLLKLNTSKVSIVQGHATRKKRIKIDLDATPAEVLARCGIDTQTTLGV